MASDSQKTLAIVGLVLNILIFPGLGTIVGGKTQTGIYQLILAVVSIPLMFVLIGFLTYFAAWIWGIFTGIEMVKAADK
jgi:TM2 domain-containing membrane protein YozV